MKYLLLFYCAFTNENWTEEKNKNTVVFIVAKRAKNRKEEHRRKESKNRSEEHVTKGNWEKYKKEKKECDNGQSTLPRQDGVPHYNCKMLYVFLWTFSYKIWIIIL